MLMQGIYYEKHGWLLKYRKTHIFQCSEIEDVVETHLGKLGVRYQSHVLRGVFALVPVNETER